MDSETNETADKSASGCGLVQDQGSSPGAISLGSSKTSPAPNAPIPEKDDTRVDGLDGAEGSDGDSDPGAWGATFRFQSQLPKLQVPPLDDTLGRYLDVVEPLLSPKAFERTRALVEEFKSSGEGDALQHSLLDYSSDKDSYLEEFWDDSYLTPKASVVLNLNPFFVFETPSLSEAVVKSRDHLGAYANHGCNGGGGAEGAAGAACRGRSLGEPTPDAVPFQRQAWRAASLLYSSLRFASAVRARTLPPDMWKNTPLCMSQYRRLFGVHRRAVAHDADEMSVYEDSGHVVVLCRNQFYYFSGLHPDGRVGVTEQDLEEIVLAVLEDADKITDEEAAQRAVGVLTTQERDDWARARSRLVQCDEDNRHFLHLVDTALFVLCLDHTSPSETSEIAAACLHGSYSLGGDTQLGTCTNRWYDKLQVIVFQNGAAGVNFEHTWVDGHTVLRFASDVFADVIYRFANQLTASTGNGKEGIGAVFPPDERAFSPCEGRSPKKIEWRLSASTKQTIYFAETRISDLIRQHDVQALEYRRFGKRFITAHSMSPDAFVQMGIVYGYYSLYGQVVSVYEPVLTKMFLKGRTEALRTLTREVKSFLEIFCDANTSQEDKLAALRDAIASHGRLVRLAAKGKGVDRHLFALLCMARKRTDQSGGDGEQRAPPVPALFQDDAWLLLNHVILSTSNCGNPSLRLFGFGPVVRDGFGVGYIIKDTQLQMVVTSKNRQTARFIGKIREFYDTIYGIYSPAQERQRMRVSPAIPQSDGVGTSSSAPL